MKYLESNFTSVWLLYWDFLTASLAFNLYSSILLDYSIKEEKKNKQKITNQKRNQKSRTIFKIELFVLVLHQWISSFCDDSSQLTLSKKQQWHAELFQVWFDAKEKWKSYFFKVRKTCSAQERNSVATCDALDFL